MKKENSKPSKKKEEDRWINVHDDDVMRAMGFTRPHIQSPRDPSVWTKSSYEKKLLKKVRNTCKNKDMHFHTAPFKTIPVKGKLIVNLHKNKVFGKTTYSFECMQHNIPAILAEFGVKTRSGLIEVQVRSYYWNGRTYTADNLPVW